MTIQITVDPSNPGQFFACCGLFELANRLWPKAEAWFHEGAFSIQCSGTLSDLLAQLANAEISSSLTDEQLDRLGTLLSAKKTSLTSSEAEEKIRLTVLWKRERLHLSAPFDIWLDWWSDDQTGGKAMKTWAAKQFVLNIARSLLNVIKAERWAESAAPDILRRTAPVEGVPFYFDAYNNSQSTPRDTGFGLYTLRKQIETQGSVRPLLELAAFLGMQRFRPASLPAGKLLRFSLWTIPLPITAAAVATTGLLNLPGERQYAFRMLSRSEYMKAVLTAEPYQGV